MLLSQLFAITLSLALIAIILHHFLAVNALDVEGHGFVLIMAWVALLVFTLFPSYVFLKPVLNQIRDQKRPAPQRARAAFFAQPTRQATIFAVPWLIAAFTTGLLAASIGPEPFRWRWFLASTVATLGIGLMQIVLTWQRTEHALAPYVGSFVHEPDDLDKVGRIGSPTLRVRLMSTYLVTSLLPLAGIVILATALVGMDRLGAANLATLTISVAITAFYGAWAFSATARSLLRTVDNIEESMSKVEDGDLSATVEIDRMDEFGRLEAGFNEMVAGLRTRDRISDLFERQVGRDVAEHSLETGHVLKGATHEVSALFIDIVSFTALTETMGPEDTFEFLNRVFGVVVAEVGRFDGFVNKFEGDAALAVFGAPRDDARHAENAVAAARSMGCRLHDMGIRFGIGIASGRVFAGNIGAHSRFEYTVIGDAVNVAARIESLTREERYVNQEVLISGSTAAGLNGVVADGLVDLGETTLRGKSEPTRIYGVPCPPTL